MAKLSLVKFMLLCHLIQCFVFRIIDGEVFLVWDSGNKKNRKETWHEVLRLESKMTSKSWITIGSLTFFQEGFSMKCNETKTKLITTAE